MDRSTRGAEIKQNRLHESAKKKTAKSLSEGKWCCCQVATNGPEVRVKPVAARVIDDQETPSFGRDGPYRVAFFVLTAVINYNEIMNPKLGADLCLWELGLKRLPPSLSSEGIGIISLNELIRNNRVRGDRCWQRFSEP